MLPLTPSQAATLAHWFLPERPGPAVGPHVLNTGHGTCWVDRWPEPRAVLAETTDNYTLLGDANALKPADVCPRIRGFVNAPDTFAPLLRAAFADLIAWPRIVLLQPALPVASQTDARVRRLGEADGVLLNAMSNECTWVWKTWGSAETLAAHGYAWGALVDGQLVSIACPFFLGTQYEDIGVATEPTFRSMGLGATCARALCADIHARDHLPSWTTSPDNLASLRVAEKLGFVWQRDDVLYVADMPIPT